MNMDDYDRPLEEGEEMGYFALQVSRMQAENSNIKRLSACSIDGTPIAMHSSSAVPRS